MKEVLKYIILVGLFSTTVIPFIVVDSLTFPYVVSKVFTFRIIVEILLALWVILFIKNREYRPRFSWIFGCAGFFTTVMLLACIFAINPYKAFWGNFERMDSWLTTVHLFGYLLIIGSMIKTDKIWLYFLRVSVFMSVAMSSIGLLEIVKNGATRISGPLDNPIYFAVYFLFNIFFAILLIYKDVLVENFENGINIKKIFTNWLFYAYSIIVVMSAYFIYLSSRGVLLGLIIGLLVTMFLLAFFEKKYFFVRRLAVIGIILIAVIVSGFIYMRQSNFVKNSSTLSRLAEMSLESTQSQVRPLLWPMAISGFKDRPMLGWGQDGFSYVFNKYYDPKIYSLEQNWFDGAHNMPLDILVIGGLLGLLAYLSLFGATVFLVWFRKNNIDTIEKSLITGLLVGYFFQNLFIFDNIVSFVLFFTILAFVHSKSVSVPSPNDSLLFGHPSHTFRSGLFGYLLKLFQNKKYHNFFFIPIIMIFMAGIIWWLNIPAISANIAFTKAIQLNNKSQINDSFLMFKKALSYKSFGNSEIRLELMLNFTKNIIKSTDLNKEDKNKLLQFIYDEGKKQTETFPLDARGQLSMAAFLNLTGNPKSALDYLKKAEELAPNYQPIRFEKIKTLMSLGRWNDAMVEAKFACELNRDFVDARFLYALTAAYNHREDIVDNLLDGITSPFGKLKEIYSIEAFEYYKAGNKAEAVESIKKIIKLNPEYKIEGEKIIFNIWRGTIIFKK